MRNILPDPIPVTVLTGFLGSGKTTALSHLMRAGALTRTLVVINEFGAVGLDHHLVSHSSDSFVMMDSGCLCCTIRSNLADTLANAYWRFARDGQRWFDRVVIETTGLANPVPIAGTLLADPRLLALYRLTGVVTTFDACLGLDTLAAQPEAVLQVALADRVLLTKGDIANANQIAAAKARISRINPGVPVTRADNGDITEDSLFSLGLPASARNHPDVERWLGGEAAAEHGHHYHDSHDQLPDPHHHHHHQNHDVHSHGANVRAICITIDQPLNEDRFETWLAVLQMCVGPFLLRMKALLFVDGEPAPFVIQAAQHLLHPIVRLHDWEGGARSSKIVIIVRDVAPERVLQTLAMLVREQPLVQVQGAPEMMAALEGAGHG